MSRSPRSVWVEIDNEITQRGSILVTLPTERVSWNTGGIVDVIYLTLSRSPRSVWVEIFNDSDRRKKEESHAPHGACELKSTILQSGVQNFVSRSPRSVWVEMQLIQFLITLQLCHAPHGACELKLIWDLILWQTIHVTLPTERVSWNDYDELEKIMREVTLPTERVNWNLETNWGFQYSRCHAPHGACEWGVEVPSYTK